MAKQGPKPGTWRQVDGDMDPGKYGGTIARFDPSGDYIELRKLQPVREYVGDSEALEVGFPFWSREGFFWIGDLSPDNPANQGAMSFCGLSPEDFADMTPEQRLITMACAKLDYGDEVDEGPSGWAKDVCPKRVHWWGGVGGPSKGGLTDESLEFRQLQRESK